MHGIKIKAFLNIALSFLFLGAAFGRYMRCMQNCAEMTFISHAFIGLVLLIGGVFTLVTKRDIPHFLYLDCAVLMSSVVVACLIFAPDKSFVGTAIIQHLVTPFAMLAYYLLFCDGRGCRVVQALTVTVFPSVYYVFMVLFGIVGGRAVYPQFDPNTISVFNILLVGVLAAVGLFAVGVILLFVNRLLRGVAEKQKAKV